jgi:hypothetical protein
VAKGGKSASSRFLSLTLGAFTFFMPVFSSPPKLFFARARKRKSKKKCKRPPLIQYKKVIADDDIKNRNEKTTFKTALHQSVYLCISAFADLHRLLRVPPMRFLKEQLRYPEG